MRHIQDTVTKAIWHFLVERAKHDLQKELVTTLYKEELYGKLLKESDHVAIKKTSS